MSRKSFWSKTLGVGVGDYYYELSVKVAEICFAARTKNGGLMSVNEVLSQLNRNKQRKARGKDTLNNKGDIEIAVQKLSKLGGGFRILDVAKKSMIVSVPTELDQDHTEVMSVANSGNGVTVDDVCSQLRLNKERAERALHLLLQEGMAWQDDFHGITYFWFPSVWKEAMALNMEE